MDFSFLRYSNWLLICFNNVFPIKPVGPTKKTLIECTSVSKNISCKAFKAFASLCLSITAVIFNSDEPCAMAFTLIPFLPNALNILAETPGTFDIFSPITAMMELLVSTTKGAI